MQKISFLLLITFFCLFNLSANDSIYTVYRNFEYITICKIDVNASDSISNAVVNDFIYQVRYDLDGLDKWALKGMNLKGEMNEIISLDFKSTTYNKENETIHGVGDVIVPYIITFKDIGIDSKMVKTKNNKGNTTVKINVLYSDAFLKKTFGYFTVQQVKPDKAIYMLEIHVVFGSFFDFFITQKRFKYIMEWRFYKLLKNIRSEAEFREKNLIINK